MHILNDLHELFMETGEGHGGVLEVLEC